MLYVIFCFFGASIGAPLGFVIGIFGPTFFYELTNPERLKDGQWGMILINNYSIGLLVGGFLGGSLGIVIAHKINRKN